MPSVEIMNTMFRSLCSLVVPSHFNAQFVFFLFCARMYTLKKPYATLMYMWQSQVEIKDYSQSILTTFFLFGDL
jgi:hypothetical protein